MSSPVLHPSNLRRWLDWKPKASRLAGPSDSKPTEPSKPSCVGFEGATSAESDEIEMMRNAAELDRAYTVLHWAGVRIMRLQSGVTIGVWSDLDGVDIRAALRTIGSDRLPVRYLDGSGIPMRYKFRLVEGEGVPMDVLAEMEQSPTEPWVVRSHFSIEGTRTRKVPFASSGGRLSVFRNSAEEGMTK